MVVGTGSLVGVLSGWRLIVRVWNLLVGVGHWLGWDVSLLGYGLGGLWVWVGCTYTPMHHLVYTPTLTPLHTPPSSTTNTTHRPRDTHTADLSPLNS